MEDTMQVNYRGHEIGEVDADEEKGNMDKDEYLYGAVIGINFETMCLDITEPTDAEAYDDDDNEVASTRQCQEREAYLQSVLASYRDYLLERSKHVLGYPSYIDNINSFGNLTQLQNIPINNVGDPFIASNYSIHSRQFEVAVLDWFARLWDLEKNQYWGYVSSGGTEGNYHGLLIGRELFPNAILYASNDSHYSVSKAALMYRMEYAKVDTLVNGEMDYANFKTKLLLNKNKPAIVIVNIGTTVKGAVDDLDLVIRTLEEAGFTDDKFYIHCDGALFGFMLPFLQNASKLTFKKPIGSITISGHKFIGCPMPCGIQITRMEHIKTLSKNVEYLASRDATIMGSRNGHTPLFLWYALSRRGYKGFEKRIQKCVRNAQYLKDRLQAEGISAMLNEVSNTVVFERPKDEEFVRHWQLACEGNISHVVVMPSVDSKKLDAFLDELVKKRSIWYKDGNSRPPCLATTIGKENCFCCLHK